MRHALPVTRRHRHTRRKMSVYLLHPGSRLSSPVESLNTDELYSIPSARPHVCCGAQEDRLPHRRKSSHRCTSFPALRNCSNATASTASGYLKCRYGRQCTAPAPHFLVNLRSLLSDCPCEIHGVHLGRRMCTSRCHTRSPTALQSHVDEILIR